MLPFEFTVAGQPFSHQSRYKDKLEAWRQAVRAAAFARWGIVASLAVPLRIAVTYYHEEMGGRIDNDNLLKPIQDALIGLVYADDSLITDTVVRKTSIDGLFRVKGLSLVVLTALAKGDRFVHVVVDHAPNHETPLK
jgi:Holliday junction resolvase RusA-like endonuclease